MISNGVTVNVITTQTAARYFITSHPPAETAGGIAGPCHQIRAGAALITDNNQDFPADP